MIKKITLTVVVLVAALLAYAATKPDTFRVQRSISIKAQPEKIFAVLNDFHQSESWSPFEKKDPTMKRTFGGAASGKGAVYEFDGNKDVGKGRLMITNTAPPSKITIALDMVEPFEAHNTVEFTLGANGDSTEVTWAMHGPQSYMMKVMGFFIDCDKMVGKDFEAGLVKLKAITQT
ncbi:MAG: SRPBCC family protein [Nitrospiraceae bacterium]